MTATSTVTTLLDEVNDYALYPQDYEGEFAVIHGLVSKPEFNNCTCKLLKYYPEKRRFAVQPAFQGSSILIALKNLEQVPDPRLLICEFCKMGDASFVVYNCAYCGAHASDRIKLLEKTLPAHPALFNQWEEVL